jgi:hypothetical protein
MKQNLKWAWPLVASGLLLTGCCCTHPGHGGEWEYKVAVTPVGPAGTRPTDAAQREKFLNELAKDGWVLVTTEGDYLYVKRPRK